MLSSCYRYKSTMNGNHLGKKSGKQRVCPRSKKLGKIVLIDIKTTEEHRKELDKWSTRQVSGCNLLIVTCTVLIVWTCASSSNLVLMTRS